ncbi:hypothetical protein [Chryseobacterium sp. ON_d1]|uniref:hypothetical protein n=1 Tax=Chryseobacterium sp. ON_d1 TaxID=2583211 RepID=UPI0011577237|nr:hypothetical protein [Chryseobacterium sp. ON_d1]
MSNTKTHTKTYKAVIMMLILVFSLSPCSVKRDVLDLFDIEYISGLNKVRTTTGVSLNCDTSIVSSKTSLSKAEVKYRASFLSSIVISKITGKESIFFNKYSGHATGNSPPKYILFKRLKLNLA